MKKIILLTFLLLFTVALVYSQEYAIDQNSAIITMTGSFSSAGGDLYKNTNDKRLYSTIVSPNGNIFILKKLFIGVGLNYSLTRQGTYSYSKTSLGPNIGYALGNAKSTMYPFATAGIRFNVVDHDVTSSQKGVECIAGVGVIIPIKKNLGINFAIDFHNVDLKRKNEDKSISGNFVNVGIGLSALIF